MYSKKVIIINQAGLYGKLATKFIQLANSFMSTLFVEFEEKKANAKSLLGVLSLAIPQNREIIINGSGIDEREAVDKLVEFIEEGGITHELSENHEDAIIGNIEPGE